MTPTDKLTVTLEVQAWEQIMRILADAPYRVSAPLIASIQGQCARQQTNDQPPLAFVPREQPGVAE